MLLGEPFGEVAIVTRPRSRTALFAAGLLLVTAVLAAGVARSVRSGRFRRLR